MEEYLKTCFRDFSPSMIMDLSSISTLVKYRTQEVIFYEGDYPSKMHLIAEGKVSIYKTNSRNEKQLLRYFSPVSLFAELANIQKIPFPASSKAEDESSVILIDFEKFEKYFFSSNISSSIVYGSMMTSLAAKLNYHVCESCFNPILDLSVSGKIARLLLDDIDEFNDTKKWEIAESLRIAPETLSRSLKRMKELGYIEMTRGKIRILDKKTLFELSKS